MLKLRFALCLALIVGILTLINGVFHGARAVTIVYRVVISTIIFSFAGYYLGVIAESFLKATLIRNIEQRQHLNVISEQQTADELPIEAPFSPFTSDNFEQISRPKE